MLLTLSQNSLDAMLLNLWSVADGAYVLFEEMHRAH